MASAAFSTNDLLIRNSRISFAKIAPDVSSREERFVVANDYEGYTVYFGPSSLISTVNGDSLQSLFPTNAAFAFNVSSQRLAIGGISTPQYAIDISSNTGIRILGGTFTGDAKGLVSVPTAALFSTLPTSIFAQQSIPVAALISTNNATLQGISVPTSSLFGTLDTPLFGISTIPLASLQGYGLLQASYFRGDGSQLSNIPLGAINANVTVGFFKPNSIPSSALPSSGQLVLTNENGLIAAPYISTGTLTATYISSVSLLSTAYINAAAITTSSFTLTGKFDVTGISTGTLEAHDVLATGTVQAGSFIGDGSQLTNIDPANLLTTIPANKFGYQTISFDSLNPYGNFQILGGSASINGPLTVTGTTTSGFFVGDGSQLTNIPFGPPLASTVAGLGTSGYLSTLVAGGGTGNILTTDIQSTLTGLGTLGYLSTGSGGGGTGNIITADIQSTIVGLGSLGYISTSIYNDAWIQSNLINPPSSITFGTPQSQSSEIYIPWTYPTQLNVGFQSSWVPVITSLTVMVSTQLTRINPSTVISNLSVGMVNYHNTSNYITGLVVTNTLQPTGVQVKTFPQDGLQRYAFVYYDPSLQGLTSNGQVVAWYNNYNVGCNMASTIFSPFLAAGPPSAPTKLQSTIVTSNTLNFFFSTPKYADTLNPTSVATISRYDLSFNSVPIPGVRYGTPIYDAQTAIINSPFTFVGSPDATLGNVIQYNATTLFPDTKYNFFVKATNSASVSGPFASTLGISTSYLLPTSGFSVNFPSRYYGGTIKRILDNITIATLVTTNTDWTSFNFVTPLHIVSNRGTTSNGIAFLQTNMSGASAILGPIVAFNGFPATTPASQTQNDLTITPTNVYDLYQSPNPIQYRGFYLNSSNTITLPQAIFFPNSNQYLLTTTLTQAGVPITSQFGFYYDGQYGTAQIISASFNFPTGTPPSYAYVSGVAVIYGTPTLVIQTAAQNVGNYFYKSPIVSYTNIAGSVTTNFYETDVSHVISGLNVGQFAQGEVASFSNNTYQMNSLNSAFATSISMSAVVSNPANTSISYQMNPLQCIIDGPSVSLLNSLPTSLPTLINGVPTVGCRIWSGTATVITAPYVYTSNAVKYSYTGFLYTSTWHQYSIVDPSVAYSLSNELQLTNGYHRSLGTRTDCYIDYRTKKYSATNYNIVDYSGTLTSGYRFATFAWKIGTQTANYSQLLLSIRYDNNTTDSLSVVNNILIFTGTSDTLKVYYRIEDSASILPTDGTSATTVWLDANGTIANSASASIYFVDSTGTYQQVYGGVTSGASFAAPTIRFPSLFIPSFATPSPKDIRLICRIGIPMNRNFAFSQVTATIS
jgi:hypothetical protein